MESKLSQDPSEQCTDSSFLNNSKPDIGASELESFKHDSTISQATKSDIHNRYDNPKVEEKKMPPLELDLETIDDKESERSLPVSSQHTMSLTERSFQRPQPHSMYKELMPHPY